MNYIEIVYIQVEYNLNPLNNIHINDNPSIDRPHGISAGFQS